MLYGSGDELFYLTDQPQHSLKMAATLTSLMATLATSELTFSAGAGTRGGLAAGADGRQSAAQPARSRAAGRGGRHGGRQAVCGRSARLFPEHWGPNRRLDAGILPTLTSWTDGTAVVRVEHFAMEDGGLHITNKAYRLKEAGFMGSEIPLTDVPRWAGLQPDLLVQGVDRPHFGLLRMPGVNTVDGSAYPVSLYANALDSIRELDATYYDFFWERSTGKRRMILDRSAAMKDPVNGKPVVNFKELASDYYMTIDMPDEKPWDDYTPDFRFDAYKTAMETQLRMLELQTGFSQGTFAIDPKTGRVTATQVISEDKTTYNTIKAIQDRGLTTGLLDILYWFDAYASIYGLAPSGSFEPSVTFGDSIFEDTGTEFARRMQMAEANYLRPELLLAWYFGVSEDKAREMMPADTGDVLTFGGLPAGDA